MSASSMAAPVSVVPIRVQMREADDAAWYAFALGVHSNIPECCAVFYALRATRQILRLNRRRDQTESRQPGYVMCPRCWRAFRGRTLTPATLHICVDSRDSRLCHEFLSGPDRVAGVPIKARYSLSALPARTDPTQET